MLLASIIRLLATNISDASDIGIEYTYKSVAPRPGKGQGLMDNICCRGRPLGYVEPGVRIIYIRMNEEVP